MEIKGTTIYLDAGDKYSIEVRGSSTTPIPKPTFKDKGKLVYKVGYISDIHMDVEDSKNSEYKTDLQNALQYFIKEGVEFISSCGDFAQYNDKDFEEFKDYYGYYAYNKGIRLYTCLGNHDYLRLFTIRNPNDTYADDGALYNYIGLWGSIGNFHNILNPSDGKYESDIHFFEHGNRWNDTPYTGGRTSKSKLNYWIERHGDIYVYISIDYGTMKYGDPWDTLARGINRLDYNNEYVKQMLDYVKDTPYDMNKETNFDYRFYDPETLIWLKGLLEDNPNKKKFVHMHHPLPNKAGDTKYIYSHLRIWPIPTSDAIKKKFYSGSNTVCGLTFHFLNKLMMECKNVVYFSGHTHFKAKAQEDVIRRNYDVRQPTGYEVTPLVDNLESLTGTEYDYRLYEPVEHSNADCASNIHIPSLSKPLDEYGKTLYQSSEGILMEVYENGVIVKFIKFKDNDSKVYSNEVVKEVEL